MLSEVINFIWIGPRMGPVHAACIRSWQRQGYRVVLHCFETPEDAPEGVEIFDAARLMKPSEIVRHKKTGSLSLASDIYRYRLLREGLGVYVDADMFCIQPLPETDYCLGLERDGGINNAILKMPADSVLLTKILEASEDPYFVPPWLKKSKLWRQRLRRKMGRPVHVSEREWGVIGPMLITHLVKANDLWHLAQPIDYFYPVHWQQLSLLFQPGLSLTDLVTTRTCAIHLCNNASHKFEIVDGTPMADILSA